MQSKLNPLELAPVSTANCKNQEELQIEIIHTVTLNIKYYTVLKGSRSSLQPLSVRDVKKCPTGLQTMVSYEHFSFWPMLLNKLL